MLEHIQRRLDGLAERLRDDPGDVQLVRLTPYEYRNIMRDLSGGVFLDAGRLLPNEGGAGEGFANVGAAQSMTPSQYEKYVDAAQDALEHLRFYPRRKASSLVADSQWTAYPRPAVDDPAAARLEVVDEVIQWFVAQQQKWNEEHRRELEHRLGFVYPAYLEAAWRYRTREHNEKPLSEFAWVPLQPNQPNGMKVALASAALRKWLDILTQDRQESVHRSWIRAWQQLPQDAATPWSEVRERCIAIVSGSARIVVENEDFAPSYEISFHEAREEVLQAAENEGRWPFRIDIGVAKELFLVVTDAGDGSRGEYAVWRRGRFVFRDGSSKPWQEAVKIVGANSGNEYKFGLDGERTRSLDDDAVGVKPPGALKFQVPENAIVFEVDLTLDLARAQTASIQALVLKNKPKSQSYIPGRFVFGGKKRPVTADAKLRKEQERALRKRNVAEANKTKMGLNAERNVFANWTRTSLEAIGGPWLDQEADRYEADSPYHYTVAEVLINATPADLDELHRLQDRLESLATMDADNNRGPNDVDLEFARQTIQFFAETLWRRKVETHEIEPLLSLFREGRTSGLSFDSSVKLPLLAIMISHDFLLRGLSQHNERDPGREGLVSLSSEALASRLSFFLWASLPDQELRDLAAGDRLLEHDVLAEQARRMLKDSRARSLAIDFAGQVWGFSDFGNFANPDAMRFPEFTPALRNAMVLEVEDFLADLFQNDRPLTNILHADYTFANDVLAAHYGLNSVEPAADKRRSAAALGTRRTISGTAVPAVDHGGDHRATFNPSVIDPAILGRPRIKLPEYRGGLATMGLFLTKTSLPLRTSPVQRGVWLMESLLGRHLPNPPADVPPLSEDDTNTAGESILRQLERHRADASCASCHDKIDPLGISLENFDAIGRWRDSDRGGAPLSTVAMTHDKFPLNGSIGLKAYLQRNTDEFIEHFNRKLLGYALGRAISIGDRFLLDRMKHNLQQNDYRFSSLVETIVQSQQFRMKREE